MSDEWKRILRDSVRTAADLKEAFPETFVSPRLERVIREFPMRINRYYAGLIRREGDPVWMQSVADERELSDALGVEDPLNEEGDSPVPHLTHRYPDRVLFLVSNRCAMYCRFCTRRRKVGREHPITQLTIQAGIDYIAAHPEVRDVVVSGGDPLILADEEIDSILARIRAIPHVQIIRVHSRVPVVLPQRITPQLCGVLRKYHPLYVNTHFNAPQECTEEAKQACWMLADTGIPLGNQSVLLRGVNDDPEIMKELCHKLLMMRVKPYYLFQADMVKGTEHLRTAVDKGVEIIRRMRGHTTGMAVPTYVVDTPGGGGKISMAPDPVVERDGTNLILENFEGNRFVYPDVAQRDERRPIIELDRPERMVALSGTARRVAYRR
ncbi:MAG: KamA family radical SAM protein [Candidatus Riflebacteria bacterium]|nr:KamA family radical SAM protein [Candidatus Riflebacteria bacterium]